MKFQPTDTAFDRALKVFHFAADWVPAYAKFLRAHGVDPARVRTPRDFAQVPPVTKDNYIGVYPRNELMAKGDITRAEIWSSSSGSTGRPTYWPRDTTSHAQAVALHRRIVRQLGAHRRRTLVVVSFAMGNWIGGTYTLAALAALAAQGHPISVITPGQNLDTVRADIAELGGGYEQVLLVGYPPFVRDVLDGAGPDVLDLDLKILMAGENIGEAWRDRILDLIGKPGRVADTCLIYGTADAGMMGHETPTTIAARRLATTDRRLGERFFGDASSAPTVVEYDARYRYTETDEQCRLLFTVANAVPLVRYRINDEGTIVTATELTAMLGRTQHALRVRTSSPTSAFLVLHGRADVAATFYAVKIGQDGIRAALADPRVAHRVTGKFVLSTTTDADLRDQLRLRVELRAGVDPEPASAAAVGAVVAETLSGISTEFREMRRVRGIFAEPIVTEARFGSREFHYDIKHTGLRRAS